MAVNLPVFSVEAFGVAPDTARPQTAGLQAALDAAEAAGGGIVRVGPGCHVVGTLYLRSRVELELSAGCVLEGSLSESDYGGGAGWDRALLIADGTEEVTIRGPGVLRGGLEEFPGGEEGFRGPHAIRAVRARHLRLTGLTIEGAGNYALYARDGQSIELSQVRIRGGHDGVHLQGCRDVAIEDCDFRTGDDCIAGTDNWHVRIERTRLNSPCNGLRFGAVGLRMQHCIIAGPGQYPHPISVRRGRPRRHMLAAFIHFSPRDRSPRWPSDNWIIEDCVIRDVQTLYAYDHERGLWQTGQPVHRVRFVRVHATGLRWPIWVRGDRKRLFELELEDVHIALAPESAARSVIELRRFGRLWVRHAELINDGVHPVIVARRGRRVEWLNNGNGARPRWELSGIEEIRGLAGELELPRGHAERPDRRRPSL